MYKKTWIIVIIGAMIFISSSLYGQNSGFLSLEELIHEALQNNPEIIAFQQNLQAARAEISPMGTLPDPMIKVGAINLPVNTFKFDQEPMTGKQIMLTQRFPFFGTLALKSELGRQKMKIAEYELHAKENEIIRKVKESVYNITYFKQAIVIANQNLDILDQFVQVASKKYETGKGLQQDVLRIQVVQSRMKEKIVMLEQKERSGEIMLNTLLAREADGSLDHIPTFESVVIVFEKDTVFKKSMEHNPMLGIMDAEIAAASARKRLTKRNYSPDLDITVAYTQREDIVGRIMTDFFTAQAGFSVPLWFWRRQINQVKASDMQINEKNAQRENMLNGIRQKLSDLMIQIDEIEKRIEIYKDEILPLGKQSLEADLSAYTVDKVDFFTLLNSQKQLFNDEMDYLRLIADYEITKAQLEEIVGERLF
jgi:cobalt-zinc-cadmium efflux system outer membrane protein